MIANTTPPPPSGSGAKLKEYKFTYYYDGTMSSGLTNATGETLYYRGLVGGSDYGQSTWGNGERQYNYGFGNYTQLSVYNLIDGEPEYIFVKIRNNAGNMVWLGLDENGKYKTVSAPTTRGTTDISFYTPQ